MMINLSNTLKRKRKKITKNIRGNKNVDKNN